MKNTEEGFCILVVGRGKELLVGERDVEATIFFSWQSDLSRKYTKDLIKGATDDAIALISADVAVDEAPRIDHDTFGIAGAPEIAATIFRKISSCSVFIADLSFIGENTKRVDGKSQKLLPNPNVLVELGFAASVIGWERIILLMNTHYGEPNELIFDLKHRRFPITFEASPKNKDKIDLIRKKLSEEIATAIRAAFAAEYESVKDAIGRIDIQCLRWMLDCGKTDYFYEPSRNTMGEVLGLQRLDDALPRLLSLGLLRCDVSPQLKLYAYHWTYLGKQVLIELGIRERIWKPLPSPFTFIADTNWQGFYEQLGEPD